MYAPQIKTSDILDEFSIGQYHARLLGNIESAGRIQYKFILAVYKDEKPCLFVASEKNAMAEEFGGGSHFLCVFEGGSHHNHGDSNDWADREKFLGAAKKMVQDYMER